MISSETDRGHQPSASGGAWALLFWVVLAWAGWAIIRLAEAQIRVAGHSYQVQPMGYHALTVVYVWVGLCFIGYLFERIFAGRWRAVGRFARIARERCLAVSPLSAVVVLALVASFFRWGHFVFLPVAVFAVGWSAGRLAASWRPEPLTEEPAEGSAVPRWPLLIVVLGTIGAAAIWSANLTRLYDAGHLGYFDTGTFASRLVNTLRWSAPFRENGAVPAFWDHFNPGFYLLTPLAAVFDPVRLLLVVQALAAAATALVWYVHARGRGHNARGAMLVALAWLLLPSVSQMTFSMGRGFHAVTLAAPLVAAGLWCVPHRRWVLMVVLAVLACSLRETVALAYVGIGLWLVAQRERRRIGALLLAVALVYFVMMVGVVIPHLRDGQSYLAQQRFAYLGDNTAEVLLSPLTRPAAFWGALFSAQSLLFALVVVCSLGLWPLLRGGRRWLAVLPGGILLLVWEDPLLRSICYHYHAITLVLLFWMAIEGVSGSGRRHHAWTLLAAAATASFCLGWWPQLRATTPLDRLASRAEATALVRDRVDADTTVAASICLAAHCTEAADVTVLPSFDPDQDEWPEMFVLDYADDWGRFELAEYLVQTRTLHRRLLQAGYAVAGVHGPSAILQRAEEAVQTGPSYVTEIPAAATLPEPVPLAPELTVRGWSIADFRPADERRGFGRVHVNAYLSVEDVPTVDLGIGLALVDPAHDLATVSASAVRPAGGMAASSLSWESGHLIAESHELPWGLPQPPDQARLKLRVDLYDLSTGQRTASTISH